jgi:hypothetical protein
MEKMLKILLAVLLCMSLADMPYGYYQALRFLAMIGFAVFAFEANIRKRPTEVVVFIALVLLFQPFNKIALGRALWNVVDVLVGIGLLISVWKSPKKNSN